MTLTRAGLAALWLSLLARGVGAQSPAPPTFSADIDMVSVTVVVHDGAGRFIGGLSPNEIEVYEDGVRQQLSYFRDPSRGKDKLPLSIVLALDLSGSMRERVRFLKDAALTFVRKLENVDAVQVVDFDEAVHGNEEFTNAIPRLETFIDGLEAWGKGTEAWGGTSLYDATHFALRRLNDQIGRKALVVLSDGDDTTSALSEREVLAYAQTVEATVYCVGIGGSPKGFLKRIAQESGGRCFFPGDVRDLTRIFGAILEELHNHYALAYSPARPSDGTWRKIEVRVLRRGAQVRVRQGYLALKRRRTRDSAAK